MNKLTKPKRIRFYSELFMLFDKYRISLAGDNFNIDGNRRDINLNKNKEKLLAAHVNNAPPFSTLELGDIPILKQDPHLSRFQSLLLVTNRQEHELKKLRRYINGESGENREFESVERIANMYGMSEEEIMLMLRSEQYIQEDGMPYYKAKELYEYSAGHYRWDMLLMNMMCRDFLGRRGRVIPQN